MEFDKSFPIQSHPRIPDLGPQPVHRLSLGWTSEEVQRPAWQPKAHFGIEGEQSRWYWYCCSRQFWFHPNSCSPYRGFPWLGWGNTSILWHSDDLWDCSHGNLWLLLCVAKFVLVTSSCLKKHFEKTNLQITLVEITPLQWWINCDASI